jgi:hypothetical protein
MESNKQIQSPHIVDESFKRILSNYIDYNFTDLESKLKHSHPPMVGVYHQRCAYCLVFGNILQNGAIRLEEI